MKVIKSKNFIVAFLVALLLVPCVFLLVACGPSTIEVSTYAELVEALSGDNEVVKLADDINVEDTLFVTRDVTLDMNGKTLSNSENIWDDEKESWSIISVRENGNLKITGNGKVLAKENDVYAVDVFNNGNLVIENGEFVGNMSSIYVNKGNAEILGGKYSIQQEYEVEGQETEYVLNLLDQNGKDGTAKIVVKGGTFVEFNPAQNYAENKDGTTNFLAEGYVSNPVEEAEVKTYVVVKA